MENVRVGDGDRVVLAYEGRKTEDGRLILDGALYWDELPLPVFAFQSAESVGGRNVVGKIVELSRNDRGEVEALMDIEMPSDYILSLDGDSAMFDLIGEPPVVVFSKMKVRGGTLIPRASWAWSDKM